MSTEVNHFPKRLHELRKSKGLSQPELGKRADVSSAIIGRYERALVTPSIEIAKRLANVLDVTLDYLVSNGHEPDTFQDTETLKRFKALSAMPNDEKAHVFFVLDGLLRDAQTRKAYGE